MNSHCLVTVSVGNVLQGSESTCQGKGRDDDGKAHSVLGTEIGEGRAPFSIARGLAAELRRG